jgi:hypothetical protein
MIEHTLYYMGKLFFFQKMPACHELWPTEIFAGPGQILGRLQFKTMYLYVSKTALIRLFDMISSSKQVFYTFWTRLLHIQKSKNILCWPSYCIKSKLDNLLVRPSQTNKLEIDTLACFFLKTSLMTITQHAHIYNFHASK